MFALVGIRYAHYLEENDYEELVALFDTRQLAEEYEKNSRLKSYQSCGRGQHGKQYRHKSLLSRFCHAYIQERTPDNPPINPVL